MNRRLEWLAPGRGQWVEDSPTGTKFRGPVLHGAELQRVYAEMQARARLEQERIRLAQQATRAATPAPFPPPYFDPGRALPHHLYTDLERGGALPTLTHSTAPDRIRSGQLTHEQQQQMARARSGLSHPDLD